LIEVLNLPASHGTQPRSAEALGSATTRSPLAHALCGRQKPLPGDGWKLLLGHGSHAGSFSLPEKWPTAHGAQVRSDVALGGALTRSPGMHAFAFVNCRFSESMQKWSDGQAAHVPLLLSPNVPLGQWALHAIAPGSVLNVPQAQFSHGLVLL
jgi:hypothetical protein